MYYIKCTIEPSFFSVWRDVKPNIFLRASVSMVGSIKFLSQRDPPYSKGRQKKIVFANTHNEYYREQKISIFHYVWVESNRIELVISKSGSNRIESNKGWIESNRIESESRFFYSFRSLVWNEADWLFFSWILIGRCGSFTSILYYGSFWVKVDTNLRQF
jgi:hypothetical protein